MANSNYGIGLLHCNQCCWHSHHHLALSIYSNYGYINDESILTCTICVDILTVKYMPRNLCMWHICGDIFVAGKCMVVAW